MADSIHELDVVATTMPVSSPSLPAGSVGTVVFCLAPDVFEVEFVDNEGRTYAVVALRQDQLLRLSFSPAAAA